VAWFMASVDSVADNTEFARQNGTDFPILSDPDKKMVKAYGALSERGFANRWTYYIDASGTVVRIDKEVKPGSAGADLARTLAELGFPKR